MAMLINRRDFLINTFKVGGVAALYGLGLSYKEAEAISIVVGQPISAACSYTDKDADTVEDEDLSLGSNSSLIYVGWQFVASNSYNAERYVAKVFKLGSPTFNFSYQLRAENATLPGALLGSTASMAANDLTTSAAEVALDDLTPYTLVATTTYWFCIALDGNQDSSNCLYFRSDNATGVRSAYSADASTWGTTSTRTGFFRIQQCI